MTELHWRDYPQLFCNDKFGIQSIHNGRSEKLQPYMIGHDLEDCTLIARHIDDMTDEEWETSNLMRKRSKEMRLKWLKTVVLSAEDMLYLLSIGVYPFKWPTDGSVVDMNTLKDEERVESL